MADMFENLVYAKEDVITFPDGIPGFEAFKQFVLVKVPEHDPFEWLVCITNVKLRFAVINPLIILPDYNPPVTKSQLASLKLEKPDDVRVYVLITLKDNLLESTANMIGPLFINPRKMIGKQIVVDSDKYSVQERVIRN
jgi:flagellar assembly factor FliW